jgi:hypothetical protein
MDTASESPSVTAVSRQRFDLGRTARNLKIRADRARKLTYSMGIIVLAVVSTFASIMFYLTRPNQPPQNVTLTFNKDSQTAELQGTAAPTGTTVPIFEDFEAPLTQRIAQLVARMNGPETSSTDKPFTPPSNSEATEIERHIDVALAQLKQAKEINRPPAPEDANRQSWTSFVSTIVLSIGAVAFVLYLLSIAVMFMRYYARLAELYDAQCDALNAADGDSEIAIKFMEHFSPSSVDIGKAPSTLYGKVLDTIQTVAKGK